LPTFISGFLSINQMIKVWFNHFLNLPLADTLVSPTDGFFPHWGFFALKNQHLRVLFPQQS
jgi:hypothetical protein